VLRRSPEQAAKQTGWNKLTAFLVAKRAVWRCELCGCPLWQSEGGGRNYEGHHVVPKARGGPWNAGNCLIVGTWCGCHDHGKYGAGLAFPIDEVLELVKGKNIKAGIAPLMEVPNEA